MFILPLFFFVFTEDREMETTNPAKTAALFAVASSGEQCSSGTLWSTGWYARVERVLFHDSFVAQWSRFLSAPTSSLPKRIVTREHRMPRKKESKRELTDTHDDGSAP
jgi:hypothetical protein